MKHQPFLNEAGIGLLEVLLATVLIVLGVVSVVKVMSSGLFSDNSVDRQAIALKLAQAKMEDVKNTAYSQIAAGTTADTPSSFADFSRDVVVGSDSPKTVTVTVSWDEQGQTNQVALTTLIAEGSS